MSDLAFAVLLIVAFAAVIGVLRALNNAGRRRTGSRGPEEACGTASGDEW